uniref:E4 protein n=1 Tax=Human papillomavirus TaxID=10566 RepID=A0A386ASK5_9PAPI|nr:MAG: E4 protein [Human papillomavirus]
MIHGTKWRAKLTIMVLITWKELLKCITFNLKVMLPDMANLESGKCMLMRTLSLLLLLALRRQLEKGPQPPSTPHPNRHQTDSLLPPPCPPENGHHRDDGTNEKHLALQPPPPGGKRDKDKEKKTQQGPPQGGDKKSPGEGTNADGDDPEKPPPPPPGEGAVEGGPQHGPSRGPSQDPDPGLLHGVAYRLLTWEAQFDQLVDTILGDLKDYWRKLGTPQ